MKIMITNFFNTLYQNRTIDLNDIYALQQFQQMGNKLGIYTYRHKDEILHILSQYNITPDFTVDYCGKIELTHEAYFFDYESWTQQELNDILFYLKDSTLISIDQKLIRVKGDDLFSIKTYLTTCFSHIVTMINHQDELWIFSCKNSLKNTMNSITKIYDVQLKDVIIIQDECVDEELSEFNVYSLKPSVLTNVNCDFKSVAKIVENEIEYESQRDSLLFL